MQNEINKFKRLLNTHIKNDTDYKFDVVYLNRRMSGQIEEKQSSFKNILEWFKPENIKFVKNCSFKSKKLLIHGRLYKITKN